MIVHACCSISEAVVLLVNDDRVLALIVVLEPYSPLRLVQGELLVKILIDDLLNVFLVVTLFRDALEHIVDRLFNFGVLPVVVTPNLDYLLPQFGFFFHETFKPITYLFEFEFVDNGE